MRNYYSFFKKLAKEGNSFINNYDIIDNHIIVYYANGDKKVMDYSEKNENNIIKTMEKQARNGRKYLSKLENTKFGCKLANIQMFAIIASALTVLALFPLNPSSIIIMMTGVFSSALLTTVLKKERQIAKELENDIQKSNLFLDNKELINENVKQSFYMLKGLGLNAKKIIAQALNEDKIININNLKDFSLEDLKRLKANIEKYKTMNPEHQEKINRKYKTLELKFYRKVA